MRKRPPTSKPSGSSGNNEVTGADAAHHADEHGEGPVGYVD